MTNDVDTSAREQAFLLIRIGRPEQALRALAKNFDAEDVWSWQARAAALLALDREDEAAEAAEQGLAVDPEHPFLLDVLAAARLTTGDFVGAEEAILSALRIDSEDADLLTRYAHIVARVGQMEKAEKLVARALSIDPLNEYALQMHALLGTASNDREAAMVRSHALLRHVPDSSLGHRLLGAAHASGGRVDDAADHLYRAASLNPGDENIVAAAREARWQAHWLLWPLRPIHRFGAGPIWIAAVVIMMVLRAAKLHALLTPFVFAWIAYCVYSWVAPPLVKKWAQRR